VWSPPVSVYTLATHENPDRGGSAQCPPSISYRGTAGRKAISALDVRRRRSDVDRYVLRASVHPPAILDSYSKLALSCTIRHAFAMAVYVIGPAGRLGNTLESTMCVRTIPGNLPSKSV
jgi:hypothetical protein